MAKKSKNNVSWGNVIFAAGVVGAVWYVVFRFIPPTETPYDLGGSDVVPGDSDFNAAQILHQVMRQCYGQHTVPQFFAQNPQIATDADFERLYKAFGVKPYDWCLYELNLPDFIYPELDLFQWIYEFSNADERAQLNALFVERGIKYKF